MGSPAGQFTPVVLVDIRIFGPEHYQDHDSAQRQCQWMGVAALASNSLRHLTDRELIVVHFVYKQMD